MLGDLLIIVPSRGRPRNVKRFLDAVKRTAELDTHVFVGVDDDDPGLPAYEDVFTAHQDIMRLSVKPRMGLGAWTNFAAERHAGNYPYLASFGDDHVPVTKGFDRKLVRAIAQMGGTGFSYPHDGVREDIPEAWVQSSDIAKTLGWMILPDVQHFYGDNAVMDLGRWAGCIRLLRAVSVEHVHPSRGMAKTDSLYAENSGKIDPDRQAYMRWRTTGMRDAVEKIRVLKELAVAGRAAAGREIPASAR